MFEHGTNVPKRLAPSTGAESDGRLIALLDASAGATWPITRTPGDGTTFALGYRAHPLIRFGDGRATVTGGGATESLDISTSGWRGPSAEVTVRGDWERRDLSILACFFVVLAPRRRGILLVST